MPPTQRTTMEIRVISFLCIILGAGVPVMAIYNFMYVICFIYYACCCLDIHVCAFLTEINLSIHCVLYYVCFIYMFVHRGYLNKDINFLPLIFTSKSNLFPLQE